MQAIYTSTTARKKTITSYSIIHIQLYTKPSNRSLHPKSKYLETLNEYISQTTSCKNPVFHTTTLSESVIDVKRLTHPDLAACASPRSGS